MFYTEELAELEKGQVSHEEDFIKNCRGELLHAVLLAFNIIG